MTTGTNTDTSEVDVEDFNFDSYHISEITSYGPIDEYKEPSKIIRAKDIESFSETTQSLEGPPMNSPWSMCSHDVRHTGRSPYNTINTTGIEKWRYIMDSEISGGVVIDNEGTIYFGADGIYAVLSNGTLKWKYITHFKVHVTPAIDENGIIFFGTIYAHPDYLNAIYTSNGTVKWKFNPGDHIFSSPAIGDDGTVYFGCYNNYFYALHPNGTLKWKFKTGNHILSSPAIGDDGTVYCGSHDHHLYAFYPENGTVKWKFKTGHYVRANPCIADDGIIYFVSRDSYLYALHPNNGTLKWKTNVHAGTSPTIGQDGTIYCGWKDLYAINPEDGSVKWTFDVKGELGASTPCNSVDGTIYFGNYDGSDIVAVNPDGTERWRNSLYGDIVSSPAINEKGTVFIGSKPLNKGYLHAFGDLESNAPSAPVIDGPTSGRPYKEYDFTFTSTSPLGRNVYYYIEWGDGSIKNWFGPYAGGEEVTVSHKWSKMGIYTIRARAKDTDNLWW
jgi:outer membrane protein assembly factor BamB